MRLAAALLLLCLPVAAGAAETTPPTLRPEHKPTPHKPISHKPAPHKPAGRKPAPPHGKPPPPKPAVPVTPPPPPAQLAPRRHRRAATTLGCRSRFASLKTAEVNFRVGPGPQFRIEWVYKRRDLPVEIEREFDNFRLVRDPQGTQGWVHQATLTGRRTAVIEGEEQVMRQAASDGSAAVANIKPGVIVRLRRCAAGSDWCEVQIGDYRGFLKRSELWGLLPGEVIP